MYLMYLPTLQLGTNNKVKELVLIIKYTDTSWEILLEYPPHLFIYALLFDANYI